MRNKGITLVALVITIIILLIISGVAISLITGGEGLFVKANKAAGIYNNAAANEVKQLNNLMNLADNYETKIKITHITNCPEKHYLPAIMISVTATDETNGINSIQLPDGKIIEGNTANYPVNQNGQYVFKATNTIGKSKEYTVDINNIITNEMITMFETAKTNGNSVTYNSATGVIEAPITKSGYALVNFTCANKDLDGSLWTLSYNYEICATSKITTDWIDSCLPEEGLAGGDFETCIIKVEPEDLAEFNKITALARAVNAPQVPIEELGQKYTFKITIISIKEQ